MRSLFLKRVMDLLGAALGLILTSPLILTGAITVYATMGAPALFRQVRPGLRGKLFVMYKFRTMSDKKDARGRLLPDRERLNRAGRFLRSTSLDELPELINVLKGDMSLVGPRPLLTQYLGRYTPEQARRHEVKPGVTGWVQVKGRNALTWEEKFKLDTWYVDNWSLLLDLKIIGLTFLKVFRREGISAGNHSTMPEFMGTREYNNSV